jgi:hypothetical protein
MNIVDIRYSKVRIKSGLNTVTVLGMHPPQGAAVQEKTKRKKKREIDASVERKKAREGKEKEEKWGREADTGFIISDVHRTRHQINRGPATQLASRYNLSLKPNNRTQTAAHFNHDLEHSRNLQKRGEAEWLHEEDQQEGREFIVSSFPGDRQS